MTHLLHTVTGAQADPSAPACLLVEVPHAAWRRRHYDAVAERLRGPLPDRLDHFFHVNTDVGAEPLALAVAEAIVEADPRRRVELLLCRVPRTFVDCNRRVDAGGGSLQHGALTPGTAPYVRDPADRTLLRDLHAAYAGVAAAAYDRVCGAGGLALTPHTYAPRTVGIDRIDDDIVDALHACWATPERWPLRAEVDLITTTPEGERLADPALVDDLTEAFRAEGREVVEGGAYALHPDTAAWVHAARYPQQVLCLEVRRDLLLEAWTPFEEQRIDAAAVEAIAGPLVASLHAALRRRER
ncbi:MAG: N-formylglutamate amidohydrolase [Alphaproteobacteria bacterium]|nr:N-formylglutamate amidohydrolase [Alphaproteobacteria bacterium]